MKTGVLYNKISLFDQECEIALSSINGEYKTAKIIGVVHQNGKVILITDNTKTYKSYKQYNSAMED